MKKSATFLGLLAMMGYAPLAHAALQISYDETSPTPTGPVVCGVGPDTGPVTCTAIVPGATLSVLSASSNSPGTPALSQQFGSSLFISTTEAVTLHIWFAAQDFVAPTNPPDITYSSSLSLTSTTGLGSVGLESCIDGNNGLAPPTTTFCGAPEATLTNLTLPYSGADSQSNTVTETVSSLTVIPFSLSQELTLTLGAGSSLNIITSQILTPVPEPVSVVLLGTVLLGVTTLLRKRAANRS